MKPTQRRKPLPCSADNCGDNYPVCGKASTYDCRGCRCQACSEASTEKQRKYYASNREAVLERNRRYYELNREAISNQHRRYYELNREAIAKSHEANRQATAERYRQWSQANREVTREHRRRHRAHKASAATVPFTAEQLRQRFAYYGNRCYLRLDGCTGGADQVEHVKPLSKGGAHMLCNLRPACQPCNSRKKNKWPFPPK